MTQRPSVEALGKALGLSPDEVEFLRRHVENEREKSREEGRRDALEILKALAGATAPKPR